MPSIKEKLYWGGRKLRMAFRNLTYGTALPLTCNLAGGQYRISKDLKVGQYGFIGTGAYIRAGITIGNGAVIGAHAVVTKDVAAYEIVAGNPAKPIRMRFTAPEIEIHEKMLAKPPFWAGFSGHLGEDPRA